VRYNPVPGLAVVAELTKKVAIDAIEGMSETYGITESTKAAAIAAVKRIDGTAIPTPHHLTTPDRCVNCNTKSSVIECRHRGNKASPHLYRRRRCVICNTRWSTYEVRQADLETLGLTFRKQNR
jgi:hypothetical protein